MKIQNIAISEIKADTDFMMREGLDKNLVAQYKDNLNAILTAAPIEVYKVDGRYILTDGFHRTTAAHQLSWETIPAVVYEGSISDAHAAACLANLQHGKPLSRQERKKAICEYIKLKAKLSNRAIAQAVSVSDMTILRYRTELEAAGEIEIQKKREGIDGRKVHKIIDSATIVAEKELLPDPFDGWLTDHIICGNSLDVMSSIKRKFDLSIVDPPYGITTEDWDLTNRHELLTFTRRWLNQVLQLLKPTARLYIFWSREYMFELKPLFDEIIETYPLHYGGMIVWHFRNVQSQPDNRKRYKLGWEPIFYYYGLDAPDLNFSKEKEITGQTWEGEIQSDVWTFTIPQSNYKDFDERTHPTQKPRRLYERIIETSTHLGESILDPFAGSGTTGHAALLTGRDFLLIEQNPEYVQSIANRLRPVWSEPEI